MCVPSCTYTDPAVEIIRGAMCQYARAWFARQPLRCNIPGQCGRDNSNYPPLPQFVCCGYVGQTKFTVYHHKVFDFACGWAVIIQISN